MSEKPVKYVASWSGGKDSTATIILCHEKGIPLDLILFSEVMYDTKRGISGEYPEQIKWMKEYAIPLFNSWGYEVKILHADGKKKDFMAIFNHVLKSGKHAGKKTGYLIRGCCWANKALKIAPIKKELQKINEQCEVIQYIGIASDEPERLKRLKDGRISLLERFGIAEKDTIPLCEKYGLLSPLYQFANRGGCWFCPNARIKQNAHFYKQNQELWNEFIDLGKTDNLISANFSVNETIFERDMKVKAFIENEERQLKLF